MFRKILIANRGEIALRIIRTCKKLKVKTVAVYSEPDTESQHVWFAEEAYEIGPGEPSESYLNIERIVGVAKQSQAEAVHPGYGFLAESPQLARACEESGIVFIGPRSRILAQVANKFESKKQASDAGVPTIPGSRREVQTIEEAEEEADRIGFPILLKATFGGGGRGLRLVRNKKEIPRAFEMAKTEAQVSFGRPDLYVEKFLQSPRHIEVQILAGPKGRIIHLGERECSIQRRYQKILEETPSPALTVAERKRLLSLALKVAKAICYENAGTVEFVRSQDGKFYYLETNKRIQVEHLVSELVTNTDIVEQQLKIASGDGLELSQNEISFSGSAINCRINAEDPERGFAPTPGRVTRFIPPNGPGVRVDTALYDGCPVLEYYDSLIAKIACHSPTRDGALASMREALAETVVEGVKTTVPVHQMLLEDPRFIRGAYHTQFLDQQLSGWKPKTPILKAEAAVAYVAMKHFTSERKTVASNEILTSRWKRDFSGPQDSRPALFVEGL